MLSTTLSLLLLASLLAMQMPQAQCFLVPHGIALSPLSITTTTTTTTTSATYNGKPFFISNKSARSQSVQLFEKSDKKEGTDDASRTATTASGDDDSESVESTQDKINAMMRGQDESSGSLFGFDMAKGDDGDDEDGLGYNAVPMFTGSIVLFVSLFFTAYGFYVGITGDDPIFQNQAPTAPPPDSWYDQYNR